ncbi:MAG: helix-turn-helix domain-containing protein [Promicromonosporaceae bacterium]|nr:helix-turn-helix domain-containing protein [Promicromonosporaceae bacterium]
MIQLTTLPRTLGFVWHYTSEGEQSIVLPNVGPALAWTGGRLLLFGTEDRTITYHHQAPQDMWGFQLAPGLGQALLRTTGTQLLRAEVPLAEVVRVDDRLVDTLWDDPQAGMQAVVRALLAKVDIDRTELNQARSIDRDLRLGRPVRDIAHRHYLSERTLLRLCNGWYGLSPKVASSLYRLEQAVALVRSGTSPAAAAASFGYFDQAHLSRHVKQATGFTLGALITHEDCSVTLNEKLG